MSAVLSQLPLLATAGRLKWVAKHCTTAKFSDKHTKIAKKLSMGAEWTGWENSVIGFASTVGGKQWFVAYSAAKVGDPEVIARIQKTIHGEGLTPRPYTFIDNIKVINDITKIANLVAESKTAVGGSHGGCVEKKIMSYCLTNKLDMAPDSFEAFKVVNQGEVELIPACESCLHSMSYFFTVLQKVDSWIIPPK